MSNLVLLINDAYRHKSGEKNSNSFKKILSLIRKDKLAVASLVLLFLLILSYVVYFLWLRDSWIFLIGYISFQVIISWGIDTLIKKIQIQNYHRNFKVYRQNLNVLKEIINKEFRLYSIAQIKILINYCDEVVAQLNHKEVPVFQILKSTFNISIPILTFMVGIIVNSIVWNLLLIIQSSIAILVSIFVGTSVVFSVKEAIEKYLNDDCRQVMELKTMLNDLYLIQIADGE